MTSGKQSKRTKKTSRDQTNRRKIAKRNQDNRPTEKGRSIHFIDTLRTFVAKFVGEIVRSVLGL